MANISEMRALFLVCCHSLSVSTSASCRLFSSFYIVSSAVSTVLTCESWWF